MSLATLARVQAEHSIRAAGIVSVAADDTPQNSQFEALTKYLPTETITLFIAAMAAKPALADVLPTAQPWALNACIYAAGAILTPLILYLLALGRFRAGGGVGAMSIAWWPPTAATIAFLVWALSVPEMLPNDGARLLAGFGALVVSTFLGLFDPLFRP